MKNFPKNIGKTAALVCVAIIATNVIDMYANSPSQDSAATPPAVNQLAHDIFRQLVEIDTTDSVGNVTTAAEAMAGRLRDAGFAGKDVIVAGPNEKKKNVVVRFR